VPKFGTVPPEVAVQSDLSLLAPKFRAAVEATVRDMEAKGHKVRVFETARTAERQKFIYGFGRDYDDGRGVVTKVQDHLASWHGYRLAADIVEDDRDPWTAPQSFWNDLGVCSAAHGLSWGGNWAWKDLPHVQWGKCRKSPSSESRRLIEMGGVEAVWRAVGAL
jgi:peptidoglycan L-alanyl-D-glutamate endopeptidase CwlK